MSLKPIDVAGFKPAVLRDQPQPMLIWVKLDELVIDHRYQRDITLPGRKAIQRIADWFDWKKYQPILVAPSEGGRMAVVDGQHRTHAAALIGIEAIPAMTVPMTPAEQAEGLVSINRDRIRMSVHNTYRAELAAGAEWAILAKAAVEAGGCALATSNPSGATKKPGTVFAINLVRKMVMNGEAEVVTQGLRAIRTSESGSRVESYGGPVLAVWFSALAQNQRFLTLTVSIANSSDLVNGTGTQFVTNVAIGKMLVIDREVIGFVVEIISNVQLRLGRAYEGPAINDASYDLVNLGAVKDGIIDLLTALKSTFDDAADGALSGRFGDGTAALPGIAFLSDLDNGFYRPGANRMAASRPFEAPSYGGLGVMQDALDITPGRVPIVGAFGWGAEGMTVPGDDIDDCVVPGVYKMTAAAIAGSPALSAIGGNSGGVLFQAQYDSDNVWQTYARHPNGVIYSRVKDGGVWGDFERTTPERDSNANGTYTKHVDGSMVCMKDVTLTGGGAATISGTWTLPVTPVGNVLITGTLLTPPSLGERERTLWQSGSGGTYTMNASMNTTWAASTSQVYRLKADGFWK